MRYLVTFIFIQGTFRSRSTLLYEPIHRRDGVAAGAVVPVLVRAELVSYYDSWTVWLRGLDPIDSIGWLLSITVEPNLPAEGIQR